MTSSATAAAAAAVPDPSAAILRALLARSRDFLVSKTDANGVPFGQTKADQISQALQAIVMEEEFDLENMRSDLNEDVVEECTTIDSLSQTLPFLQNNDAEKSNLWLILQSLFKANTGTADINWKCKITEADIAQARAYINQQCDDILKTPETDLAFLSFVVIGQKNSLPNLSVLLYDIYTKFKVNRMLSNNNKNSANAIKQMAPLNANHFVQESQYLQDKDRILRSSNNRRQLSFKGLINDFENRMNPRLRFSFSHLINDHCEVFVDYTLMLASIINDLIKTNHFTFCPMQIDLVIIPQKIEIVSLSQTYGTSDDYEADSTDSQSSSDEPESDDEDEHSSPTKQKQKQKRTQTQKRKQKQKQKQPQNNNSNNSNRKRNAHESESHLSANIPSSFSKALQTVLKRAVNTIELLWDAQTFEPNFSSARQGIKRELLDILQTRRHQRVQVIIDRRFEPNQVFVYQLPSTKTRNYSQIPNEYCIENLIHSSLNHLIPMAKARRSENPGRYPFIGGRHSDNGGLFAVSFQCMQRDNIRMHWFTNGSGIRLWPENMITLWPRVFLSRKLQNRQKYTTAYVHSTLALDVSDMEFDSWSTAIFGE